MKIAVLLSGGVDSSLALSLLKQEGRHDITAFYIKIWLEDELSYIGNCPWETDMEYARNVCEQTGVPLKIVPLQTEYREIVTQHALNELRAGRTPSPDILCNQHVKFGLFQNKIDPAFEKVASGHYARIEKVQNQFLLKRSPDPVKDQTYFLCYLKQQQLSRTLFPIGRLTKKEVRRLADEMNLPTKDRKDSQGICFLGQIQYPEFVRFHLGEKRGDIIDTETGNILGEHNGYWFYTIGQRQGLGLGGGPWFVVGKDIDKNIVYVSHKELLQESARSTFNVGNLNWISLPPTKTQLQLKVRHGPHLYDCEIQSLDEDKLSVAMSTHDTGIAPGQYAVFYDADICLGGGVIE
ncbi:MAG: tRNA 2-thiouridine(34) synthase MnmA [Verrucomicrobia bacterium]|nr:tRNA 2-thiouridine(34) synthase MnmA [Verrucomicrobiota bacterium]MCF7708387.1 tRNA 2-thiouridine(34) synthase MnmA [Verrucomicrobiota bacterium]